MRFPKLFGALLLLLSLSACTEQQLNPVAPANPTPADLPPVSAFTFTDLVGTWLLESGSMMSDFVGGLATYSVTADVTAIRIDDDGMGHVWLFDRLTGAKDCIRAFVLYDDDDQTLVFDFAAEQVNDVVFNLALERYTYIYPIVAVDSSQLGIADTEGRVALFSRQAMLPSDVTCEQLQILDQHSVPAPQYFGDLAHYGGDLIFNGYTQIETFDLTTGTLGTPLGPNSSRLVQTTEGGFFWTHCGCGGSRDAYKRTISTVFDTVSSEDEMGEPITFRAMAYMDATDRLWLHGRPFDNQYGQFFVMNTNSEPDLVEDTISFNRDIRAMTFDGDHIWAVATVASQTIVRLDPVTADVIESYDVPDPDVSWSGLEVVADIIYMLGTGLDGNGVIVELAVPSTAIVGM